MTDEFGVDVAIAIELGLEGEDDEHLGDALLHPCEAAALPCPELWADQIDDRNAEALEVFGEAEVDVGKVDEDGDGGAIALDAADELAVLRVDVRRVADDLGDAHVGDVFGTDDTLLACLLHLLAAETEEGGGRNGGFEGGDELRAVMVSAGFACREEDARVGWSADELSLVV